jgi:hypothetical protein
MGALEHEPANHDVNLNESSKIEIEQLTELAREILNKRENDCRIICLNLFPQGKHFINRMLQHTDKRCSLS